ncbi:MAG: hypothetical protein C0402_06815 [Thermodesulfovibrio sp.]|nr:hypothetical protein [Thermodesulfovibrio sp.]
MIVRHDMDLESLGVMAQIPDDLSPLQRGSRGKYSGTGFEVVGRLKVAWSEGYWNEWFLSFEDGRRGWLGEAMGFFMLSFEAEGIKIIPDRSAIKPGETISFGKAGRFVVDDIKEATCIGSEGELPFPGLLGRKTTSIDLSSDDGNYANIEYSEQDGVTIYFGRYVEFPSFDWSNLRDLSSEVKKVRSAAVFKCPDCGGPGSLRTPGLTASVVCSYCSSVIDTTNQQFALLQKAEKKTSIKPLIPLGKKGRFGDTDWENIGFMRRTDDSGLYSWDEYLLFNPFNGFRWLTTYNGHWNFIEMLRTRPPSALAGPTLGWHGRMFRKFLEGKAKVSYVLGEFYWRVKVGETVDVVDYISPPEILSSEGYETEITWSLGKYLEPGDVAGAFVLGDGMPEKVGVAPNQPNPYASHSRIMKFAFLAFAIFITLLQMYFVVTSPDKEVFRETFSFRHEERTKAFVTKPFELSGGQGNLSVKLHADVQNDWMEAAIDLVDETTNKTIAFSQTAEHYSGVDGGESWTEGSQDSRFLLNAVPGGRYHLLVQPAADTTKPGEKTFTLSLRRGVVTWSNFFLGLVLLLIYPLCTWCRKNKFEVSRWAESDLSPTGADNSEDDEGE